MDSNHSIGEKQLDQSGFLRIVVQWWADLWPLMILLVSFLAIFKFLMRAGTLPEEAYQQVWIASSLCARVGILWLPILALSLLALYRGNWNCHWSAVSESSAIRVFVTGIAALLAWNYVIMDCNHYFAQWHLMDRGLLAGLVVLIWYSPLAVFPFCLILVAFQGQFHHPDNLLPHFWTEKNLALRMLALFVGYHALVLCFGRRRWPFVYCLLLLLAAHYWPSGWSKVKLRWLLHNDLSLVSFSSYANGWRSWLSYEEIVSQSHRFRPFSVLACVFTQVAETIVIFLVWRSKKNVPERSNATQYLGNMLHRWRLPGILIMLMALHIGIWQHSGICFLTWIVVELLLLGYVWALIRRDDSLLKFSTIQQVCFIVLVILGNRWCESTRFSWFETRACYAYRVEALDESGDWKSVPAPVLAPYDFAFTWTVCNYLYPEKQLNYLRYGNVANSIKANEINALASVEDFYALEQEKGLVSYDAKKAEQFKKFLATYFANLNQSSKAMWLDTFQRPCEIVSSPRPDAYLGNGKVSRVRVKRVTTFYDGKEYFEPRVEQLFEVDIE